MCDCALYICTYTQIVFVYIYIYNTDTSNKHALNTHTKYTLKIDVRSIC